MKKNFLSIVALGILLVSCDSTPKFKINVNVDGDPVNGKAYLLDYQGRNQFDTIAVADIKANSFEFSGSVSTVGDYYIGIDGMRQKFMIFVDNNDFTVKLKKSESSNYVSEISASNRTQELANRHQLAEEAFNSEVKLMRSAYNKALKAKDKEAMDSINRHFDSVQTKLMACEDSIKNNFADDYYTAYLIVNRISYTELDELESRYAKLSETVKAGKFGKQIAERITVLKATAISATAPDFTQKTPKGEDLAMSSVKAKVKIIDFWASWCGPCRAENPNVVKIYKKYHSKGLEILSVSLDTDKEKWLEAIEKDGLEWNHVSDLQGWSNAAAKKYGVNAIPCIFILDENNKILAKNLRGEKLEKFIEERLK